MSGDARNALNVVDNPQLIGQMVKVWGELLNDKANPLYLQKPGVRNVKNNDQYVRPWDQDEPEEYDPTGGIVESQKSGQSPKVESQGSKAAKIIRNGQLYIKYNGTMYNVQGREVDIFRF